MDFTNGLEIMAVPSKETLIYVKDIYTSWVQNEELNAENKIVVTFNNTNGVRVIK